MKTWFITLSILISFSMGSATIINVPGDSSTIQGGINGSSDGDTVLVQPGTYVENIVFGGHNIVLGSLFLTTGDTSYISTTIIDGDSAGTVVTLSGGQDSTSIITGFTIQHGYADLGGGIKCINQSNPKILHNSVLNNSATEGGGIYFYQSHYIKISRNFVAWNYASDIGGGILCAASSLPEISNNNIHANVAEMRGGGIHSSSTSATIDSNIITQNYAIVNTGGGICCPDDHSTISSNFVSGNYAEWNGGGIDMGLSYHLMVINNVVTNNSAHFGAGIHCSGFYPVIRENTITNNHSTGNGGGIHFYNSRIPTFIYNTVSGNTAAYHGGGIYCVINSNPYIDSNLVIDNSAPQGGGIWCGGSSPTITNSILNGNSAIMGAGIYCYNGSEPSIENSTVCSNNADSGGGFYILDSSPTILNSIFWADKGNIIGHEIYFGGTGSLSITYCDIAAGWPGEGNIDCCPEFCSPGIDDFHLTSGSCCLGAGQNGVDMGALGAGCDSLNPNCSYVTGDVNGTGDYNGLDVTYGVSYLKGGIPPAYECECTSCNIWYASGDVNGSCNYNGLDITYGISYLKGILTELIPCPDCPPVR